MSFVLNPPSYSLLAGIFPGPLAVATEGCGLHTSELQHLAVLLFITSARTIGSTPSSSPRLIASQTPIICDASARLLQSFAADPVPGPPQPMTRFPIRRRYGEMRSKVSVLESEPTIKVSVPSSAPFTPPDTGASTRMWPFLKASSKRDRESKGFTVEVSMKIRGSVLLVMCCGEFAGMDSRSAPSTFSTAAQLGRLVMIIEQSAISFKSDAGVAPPAAALATASGFKS
mmetsp:Transcript_32784/g.43719  ORF Transcript_32784/g.43719 Transcript_32784/m.43719 type:complete len:229 (+) Transcript_32784:513-1199(+)